MSFQKGTNDKNAASLPRHFDRSEAEWRNLLPPMVHEAWRREISRLRVSSKSFPSAPYRHAAPLEMTVLASSIQSFQKGANDKNAASHSRHFDRSVAEWRNLLPLMVHEAWRPKISGLRVPIEPCIPACSSLEMTRGSPLLSWNQNKGIKKKPSFESFFFVYETRFSFLFRN